MLVFARGHLLWSACLLIGAIASVATAHLLQQEFETSRYQARIIADEASHHFFWLHEGPGSRRPAAPDGPFDRQRGYTEIPHWTERLVGRDYEVTWQTGVSSRSVQATQAGLYPIYDPAPQAGLTIVTDDGAIVHDHRTPTEVFEDFDELPALLVDTLLFIENRELLQPGYDYRNPAVEWRRFASATAALAGREMGVVDDHFGGSTLATQIEKFRHSSRGITDDEAEKARQMLSASLRAYQDGPRTGERRRSIVLDYVNAVPLAASPGYGEVQGVADGLRVWFGADPQAVVHSLEILAMPSLHSGKGPSAISPDYLHHATHYRMVLSLFLAQRRPTLYLLERPDLLHRLTDNFARILANEGQISPALRDAVLLAEPQVLPMAPAHIRPDFARRKAVDAVRGSLREALDVPTLYELDRHDLTVQSTIDGRAQDRIDEKIQRITDPEFLEENGLFGHRLLRDGDPIEELTASFTLFERTPQGNALRVLADNHDQPLNINEHIKLDLGSTAKLRTLVTYLELIAELHEAMANMPKEELEEISQTAPDGLRRWTAARLATDPDLSIEELLNAAMEREYSADPNTAFFTGGGMHRFSNFEGRRNHTQSVQEAFRHSVNLVFIHMMQDIADHFIWLDPERVEAVLGSEDTDERRYLLSRFAEREGITFQSDFLDRYIELAPEEIAAAVVDDRSLSDESLAMIAMSFSDQTQNGLREFVTRHGEAEPDDARLKRWWRDYSPEALSWQDRGYLTRIHPLELWTAAWLREHPQATRAEAIVASREVRQHVYQWLFRTRHRGRQDQRIRTLLEVEAFDQIHSAWTRLGYPFGGLTPSLATSIGSSADRPTALAELVGILAAGGLRFPNYRVSALIAGPDTPYETRFERRNADPERVLPEAVAATAHRALIDVVENGTGRRLAGVTHDSDGHPRRIGGKTGTGDHDHKIFDGLRLVESRPVHRTATFVFVIDERFFGTLTVFVSGEQAGEFRFTSALPTTLLGVIYPALEEMMERTKPGDSIVRVTDPGGTLAVAARGGTSDQIRRAAATSRPSDDITPPPFDWARLGELEQRPDNSLLPDSPEVYQPRLDWMELFQPPADEPSAPDQDLSADAQSDRADTFIHPS